MLTDLTPQATDAIQKAKDNKLVDSLEQAMIAQLPHVDAPLTHTFTPGLYCREIFLPMGTLITSKIHKTEHPFVILSGKVAVWSEEDGESVITAPHFGVTKPGTRRVVLSLEDTRWVTFHAVEETDLEKIEDMLIEPHNEHLHALPLDSSLHILKLEE